MFAYCSNDPVNKIDPTGEIMGLFTAAIIISIGVNHVINKKNEKKIDSEIKESYMEEEAKAAIKEIIGPFDKNEKETTDRVVFEKSSVKIIDSYKVTSRYERQKICKIISRTSVTSREYDNMSAEWLGHNICYFFHVKRDSTKDVDIDYDRDPRFVVRAGAKALEILGWD